jgi:hypothetical protein
MSDANMYGYDAFRTMWRIALDWEWNREPRASAYLAGSHFLRDVWRRDGRILPVYNHDGTPASSAADLTAYGGDIGNFQVVAATTGRIIVRSKILTSLKKVGGQTFWDKRYNYYEQNWLWFGLALAGGRLSNFQPSSATG